MRSLSALQGMRCRFTAIYAGKSPRGHLILINVSGPAYEAEHIWVREREWATRLPAVGRQIDLVGTVMPYWHDDEKKDYTLVACREVRP